uniref:Secreted protein n=1 Tax=Rhipicephalus microplus TaxID=6941 RepID=A0A6G5A376_RHIMP
MPPTFHAVSVNLLRLCPSLSLVIQEPHPPYKTSACDSVGMMHNHACILDASISCFKAPPCLKTVVIRAHTSLLPIFANLRFLRHAKLKKKTNCNNETYFVQGVHTHNRHRNNRASEETLGRLSCAVFGSIKTYCPAPRRLTDDPHSFSDFPTTLHSSTNTTYLHTGNCSNSVFGEQGFVV